MKRRWVALFSVALCAVPVSGCGTVCNLLSQHPKPYGGLAKDFSTIGSPDLNKPVFHQGDQQNGKGGVIALGVILGLGATELCATGLADTLCLPFFYLRDGELFPYPYDRRYDDTPCESPISVPDDWPPYSPVIIDTKNLQGDEDRPATPATSLSGTDPCAPPPAPSLSCPLDFADLLPPGKLTEPDEHGSTRNQSWPMPNGPFAQ
jgi:hypothetical protein